MKAVISGKISVSTFKASTVWARFYRTSFASQYFATGIIGLMMWAFAWLNPPPMPLPEGPVPLYTLLYDLFSPIPLLPSILGFFLVLGEAFWINSILSKNELIPKNSSLVALLFVLLMSSSPQALTLTPVNITAVFLVYIVQILFASYSRTEPTDLSFGAGFFIALASLFYYPFLLFYLFLLTSFIVYRSMKWREWLSSLIGLVTPFLFLATFYYWTGDIMESVSAYLVFPVEFRSPDPGPGILPGARVVFILAFTLAGLAFTYSHRTEKTVEIRKKTLLMIWLLFWSIVIAPVSPGYIFFQPVLAFIPVAFFFSNRVLGSKKPFAWELLLWGFLFLLLAGKFLPSW